VGYSQVHRGFVSVYLDETLTAPRCISVKHRRAYPWVFIDAIKSPQRTRPSALMARGLYKSKFLGSLNAPCHVAALCMPSPAACQEAWWCGLLFKGAVNRSSEGKFERGGVDERQQYPEGGSETSKGRVARTLSLWRNSRDDIPVHVFLSFTPSPCETLERMCP
jgi:hypothetical protein